MKSAPAGTTRSIRGSSIEVLCPVPAVLVPIVSGRHPGLTTLLTLKDYHIAAFPGCLRRAAFDGAAYRRPLTPKEGAVQLDFGFATLPKG